MAYTYQQLKPKTVNELRDIAKDIKHDAVQGYSQMHKERLLPAICTALGIDMHEHYSVHGIDKAGIKAKIRALKAQRDTALEARREDELKSLRRQIHRLNHQIRAHMS
jgi:DNA-binding IclR family transcriptional regulator